MAHFAFTHKQTGEIRFGEHEMTDDWEQSAPLSRKPTMYDKYIDGELVKDNDLEKKTKKRERANKLSREELVDRLEALEAKVSILEAKNP